MPPKNHKKKMTEAELLESLATPPTTSAQPIEIQAEEAKSESPVVTQKRAPKAAKKPDAAGKKTEPETVVVEEVKETKRQGRPKTLTETEPKLLTPVNQKSAARKAKSDTEDNEKPAEPKAKPGRKPTKKLEASEEAQQLESPKKSPKKTPAKSDTEDAPAKKIVKKTKDSQLVIPLKRVDDEVAVPETKTTVEPKGRGRAKKVETAAEEVKSDVEETVQPKSKAKTTKGKPAKSDTEEMIPEKVEVAKKKTGRGAAKAIEAEVEEQVAAKPDKKTKKDVEAEEKATKSPAPRTRKMSTKKTLNEVNDSEAVEAPAEPAEAVEVKKRGRKPAAKTEEVVEPVVEENKENEKSKKKAGRPSKAVAAKVAVEHCTS